MCTFVTLFAATDDLKGLNAVLETLDRRGYSRRAKRVDMPGLLPLLGRSERAYWLVRPPCDCGTFLGHALNRETDPEKQDIGTRRANDSARYRRKGWSDARIARALAEKDRADARPDRRQPNEDGAYWMDLMRLVAQGLGLKRLGLMHHVYSKAPGAEPAMATRQDAGLLEDAAEGLAHLVGGVIHDFGTGVRSQ